MTSENTRWRFLAELVPTVVLPAASDPAPSMVPSCLLTYTCEAKQAALPRAADVRRLAAAGQAGLDLHLAHQVCTAASAPEDVLDYKMFAAEEENDARTVLKNHILCCRDSKHSILVLMIQSLFTIFHQFQKVPFLPPHLCGHCQGCLFAPYLLGFGLAVAARDRSQEARKERQKATLD